LGGGDLAAHLVPNLNHDTHNIRFLKLFPDESEHLAGKNGKFAFEKTEASMICLTLHGRREEGKTC